LIALLGDYRQTWRRFLLTQALADVRDASGASPHSRLSLHPFWIGRRPASPIDPWTFGRCHRFAPEEVVISLRIVRYSWWSGRLLGAYICQARSWSRD
jgi:hypothetical protein